MINEGDVMNHPKNIELLTRNNITGFAFGEKCIGLWSMGFLDFKYLFV